MSIYVPYDYLCNEPFYIDGIGTVRCPTLRDIRKITYRVFSIYLSVIAEDLEDYLKITGLLEKYNSLSEFEKQKNNLFNLMLFRDTQLLFNMLSFFFVDRLDFNKETVSFDIYSNDKVIGCLNSQNFDIFKNELQCILGIQAPEEQEKKYKNKLAKEMDDKFKKHNNKSKSTDDSLKIENMIRKYCVHNKNGINILNVWDLTYYQFISMFTEYCNARNCDFNYLMATNSFTYTKNSDYDPLGYLKKTK